jgi:hypothetical protein
VAVTSDLERRGAEQWFRRRGLPAVVRGRPEQVVVRALPAVAGLMVFDLLTDVLGYLDGDGEFTTRLGNVAFVLLYLSGLLASLVAPVVVVWLVARRTRRWVLHGAGLLPAVLLTAGYVLVEPAVDNRLQQTSLLPSIGENLVVAGVLVGLTAIGVGSVFCWALRAALRQLRGLGAMTSRSLPLLLLVTTFGFFTAEIWQAVGSLPKDRVWLVVGFFGGVAVLFLFSVMSEELRTVTALSESMPVTGPSPEYPFHRPVDGADEPAGPVPPLTRVERVNMVLILLLTQALQALVFGILVLVLFLTLGWLAVPRKVMAAWAGHPVTPGTLFGVQVPIAAELLHVCMLIAAFSGLYFIVTVVTDAAHRSTFYQPGLDHLQVSLAARSAYLARFAPRPAGVSAR